jgi:hypothetical protein
MGASYKGKPPHPSAPRAKGVEKEEEEEVKLDAVYVYIEAWMLLQCVRISATERMCKP